MVLALKYSIFYKIVITRKANIVFIKIVLVPSERWL